MKPLERLSRCITFRTLAPAAKAIVGASFIAAIAVPTIAARTPAHADRRSAGSTATQLRSQGMWLEHECRF